MRRLGVIASLVLLLALPGSASGVSDGIQPTLFSGYAFDACSAPSLAKLQAWQTSPYRAVGIYIGGVNRACGQANLTPVWVQSAVAAGWSLLPLYVGVQAPCVSQSGLSRISGNTSTAATQAQAAAADAIGKAQALGLPTGSPLYFDLEGYRLGDAACTRAVQSFVAAWVDALHAQGFVAGLYGSAASTIRDVSAMSSGLPDLVWIADWDGVESVFGDKYVTDGLWVNHQRIHQYKGGHDETYGGVKINIDSSVVDATVVSGTGTPPPPPPPPPTVPAGTVTSADGLASVSWPAEAFATEVVVALTTVSPAPTPATYAVDLTVTESDNQAPVPAFGAPVTLKLLRAPVGSTPAYSPDGTTWQALPKLTAAGLSGTTQAAYTTDADGTIEIQTLLAGRYGLLPDMQPPSRPLVTARLASTTLTLTWPKATDNVGVAAYNVLRNGTTVASLPGTANRTTVRGFSATAPTVFRLQALDAAGNAGRPSRAVVVVAHRRPPSLPHTIPAWAYALYSWQRGGGGARPAAAPKHPPAWYWLWAGWRSSPFRLR